ncbi:hypothetical protein N2603_23305 [Bradyrhizobium huanghuaihaiense]|uniref:hypothetical protein n=1 Tax=Bradyrhizobium huanghuaihaiense TaxID=990078 RepID=UPI0021AA3FC2|nr:hypothetical protein [Bradyrhizobium sp. CB3035]UWU73034.1 hypothetical protein N2603_23305 [Bradyrhizobium sp. CB3035]
MKDMLEHLAMLREQIVKCERLRNTARSQIKRAAFERVVAHYKVLAGELERAIEQERKKAPKREAKR